MHRRAYLKNLIASLSLPVVLMIAPLVLAKDKADKGATYTVTFTAAWTKQTHPNPAFPNHPFFSPMIGAVHSPGVEYWKVGGLSSPGIKLLAEEGGTELLANEVKADMDRGRALDVLGVPYTTDSPGTTTIRFHVEKRHPLVTLVTMLAPTPDWFTGVAGLDLLDAQGHWVDQKVVMLYPFDAGTEQNGAYALHQPPEPKPLPIYSLSGTAWFTSKPIGSFTFRRLN
jgi:Spondin_N